MARRTRSAPHNDRAEQEIREQEVLRANKELAAYFKGRRTEREAKAALKIIKAFIRYREDMELANRRPLPGADRQKPAKSGVRKRAAGAETGHRRARLRIAREPSAFPQEGAAAPEPAGTSGAGE
jgi:hypothetical protein